MPTLFPKDNRSVQAEIPPSGFAGNSRSNRFAFQLFAALAPGKENLAICPDGARILLSLLWSAASGETRKQMGSVLELGDGQDGNENWYERRGRPLGMTLVKAEQGEEFLTTSGLWCDQQFCLNDAFAASARTDYATEVQKGDFVSEHTLEQVNSWVSHQTRGKIARIVENLAPLGPLVAVNAVYFRGKWLESFSKRQTEEEDFFLPDSGRRKVPMMRRSDFFEYAERNGTQMVGLPYSGSLQMLVVLPPNGVKIEKFCQELHKTLGPDWRRLLESREGKLRMPRFRIQSDIRFNDALRVLGMRAAFDPEFAEFETISNVKPLFLGGIQQKDFVEVDEEGTEAAAATAAEFCLSAPHQPTPPPPFEMIVNRPFVFAICDAFTGVILFLGTVANPLAGI